MLPSVLEGRRRRLFAALVVIGLTQAAVAACLAMLIDAALQGGVATPQGASWRWPETAGLVGGGLALVLLKAWQRRCSEAIGLSFVHDIRLAVLGHVMKATHATQGPALAPIATRLTNDLLSVKNWISYGLSGATVAAASISALVLMLGLIDARLATVSLLAIAAAAAATILLLRPLDRTVREARKARGTLATNLAAKLDARLTLRAFDRADHEMRKIAKQSETMTLELTRRGWWSGLVRHTSEMVIPLSVVLLLAAQAVSPATGTSSGSLAWMFVMGLLLSQLQEVARAADYWINYRPSIVRLERVFDIPATPLGGLDIAPEALPPLEVETRVLTAGEASSAEDAERHRLIVLDRNEHTAEVVRRLANIERDKRFALSLGGIPLADISAASQARLIACSSPELGLLRGSVGGNIRKSMRVAEGELTRILAACRLDGEGDVTSTLATPVSTLSPAAAARVRIARALARAPLYLVLDEEILQWSEVLRQDILTYAHSKNISVILVERPGLRSYATGVSDADAGIVPR